MGASGFVVDLEKILRGLPGLFPGLFGIQKKLRKTGLSHNRAP
jgi:hypothetical protein